MGTFGALMGSLIAGLAYTLSGRNYAVTFSLSALPALGALLLVTTVGHIPNCTQLYAELQQIACLPTMPCMLSSKRLYARLLVGHTPDFIRLCTQLQQIVC